MTQDANVGEDKNERQIDKHENETGKQPRWAAWIALQLAGVVLVLGAVGTVFQTVDGTRPTLCAWNIFPKLMCDTTVPTDSGPKDEEPFGFAKFSGNCTTYSGYGDNHDGSRVRAQSLIMCDGRSCLISSDLIGPAAKTDYGSTPINRTMSFDISHLGAMEYGVHGEQKDDSILRLRCEGNCVRVKGLDEPEKVAVLYLSGPECSARLANYFRDNNSALSLPKR